MQSKVFPFSSFPRRLGSKNASGLLQTRSLISFVYRDNLKKVVQTKAPRIFKPKLPEAEPAVKGPKPKLPRKTIAQFAKDPIILDSPKEFTDEELQNFLKMRNKKPADLMLNQMRTISSDHREPLSMFAETSNVFKVDRKTLLSKKELEEEMVPLIERNPLHKYENHQISNDLVAPTIKAVFEKVSGQNASSVNWMSESILGVPWREAFIIESVKACKKDIPNGQLTRLRNVADMVYFMERRLPIPIIRGNPLSEVFEGQIIPPNVNIKISLGEIQNYVNARDLYPNPRDLYEEEIKCQP